MLRSVSAPDNRQEVPIPHRDWSGLNEVDAPAARSIMKRARLWRPLRTILEPLACTLARYAHRVIDRTTGIPYSADELELKILDQITAATTSTGGNGAADEGKGVAFDASGGFKATGSFGVNSPTHLDGSYSVSFIAEAESAIVAFNYGLYTSYLGPGFSTGNRTWELPNKSGTVALTTDISTAAIHTELGSGNAGVAQLGEHVQASDAIFTALTTGVAVNVGFIDLTAGDWDVEGMISWEGTGAEVTQLSAGFNTVSATVPSTPDTYNNTVLILDMSGVLPAVLTRKRYSLAAPARIYLVSLQFFGTGTLQILGYSMSARRVR